MLISIIMAGGLGKRMNSDIPKVLHEIKNKPMICYVIDRAIDINSHKILIVVGKYKEIIKNSIYKFYSEKILEKITFIDQPCAYGTGNAIQCCIPFLSNKEFDDKTKILILSGDVPLISFETLFNFINFKQNSNCLMTYNLDNPYGYGRILLENDIVKCIIEEKDCSDEEKTITTVNCGVYYLDKETCINILPLINNNNNSNEYYLTDMIKLSHPKKSFIKYDLPKEKYIEIANINTVQDLEFVKSNL